MRVYQPTADSLSEALIRPTALGGSEMQHDHISNAPNRKRVAA